MYILQNRMRILALLGSRMRILMPTYRPVDRGISGEIVVTIFIVYVRIEIEMF